MKEFEGAVVIPARFESSRFPGKPLAIINEIPMIQHVFKKCSEAVGDNLVYVATDSPEIKKTVEGFGGNVVMTSKDCLTGTDRLAEANRVLKKDFLINVQGDEPMVSAEDIKLVYKKMKTNIKNVINCYCDINEDEIMKPSIPKVLLSKSSRLLYISRGGIPFDKLGTPKAKYKQICIYGFSAEHLEFFNNFNKKTSNENIEDIEILRFLDMDIGVDMIKVNKGSIAVDTPEDLALVKKLMKR